MGYRPKRLAVMVGGGLSAIALAAFTASTAMAGTGAAITTNNGEAGYGTTAPAHHTISNVQAVVTANQYGTTVQGGAVGLQLATTPASSGTCFAGQLGLVANTNTATYSVEYGAATIGSSTEKCPAGGVLDVNPNTGTAHTLGAADSVKAGDSVWLSLTYVTAQRYCIWAPWFGHGHHSHRSFCFSYGRDGLVLSSEDLNATNPTVTSAFYADPHTFTNASFGISLDNDQALVPDTAGVAKTEPASVGGGTYTSYADQQVAEFDYSSVTLDHTHTPLLLDNSSLTPSVAYDKQLASPNDVIVAPNGTLSDSAIFTGGTLPVSYVPANVHGASTVGNSFELFTGNSVG